MIRCHHLKIHGKNNVLVKGGIERETKNLSHRPFNENVSKFEVKDSRDTCTLQDISN